MTCDFKLTSSVDLPEPLAPRTLMRPFGFARIRPTASSNDDTVWDLSPSRSTSLSSLMRASNFVVELRMRVRRDAAQPRPHRQELVPARGELMHVVRHLDLARQRRDQRDQRRRIAGMSAGDVGHGAEHDRQADDGARCAQALLGHDRLDLRLEAVAQLGLEAGKPEPQIVAVAGEDVVPRGVALRGHAVGHALVVEIGARDRLAHRPLHREQHDECVRVGHRQRAVDLGAQHDHVEDQAEQQAQVAFDLEQQMEIDVERLTR